LSTAPTFWDRRKAAVDAEERDAALAQRDTDQAAQDAALADKTDEDLLAELNLPNPDTLVSGDDVKAFMSKAVPERLRRRALRALWRTNPVLANLDSLVDYGEDFTDAAMVVANMSTTHQVGKGMLAHVEKMAQDAEDDAARQDAPEPVIEDAPVASQPETVALQASDPVAEHTATAAPEPDIQPDSDQSLMSPAPRRMAFIYNPESS